jgi:hypothetical protein
MTRCHLTSIVTACDIDVATTPMILAPSISLSSISTLGKLAVTFGMCYGKLGHSSDRLLHKGQ